MEADAQKPSILTIAVSKASDLTDVYIYKDTAMKKDLNANCFVNEGKTLSTVICVDAGTYYFYVYSWHDKTPTKFKVTAANATNAANYCKAKASALKAGTTVKIAQTPKYDYDRWYKITLDKAKKVKFTTNQKSWHINIFDANGKNYNTVTTSNGKSATTEKKLPAGTYFVGVESMGFMGDCYGLGEYLTLKWP